MDLTPEQQAKFAVDGAVVANGSAYIEASNDPADIGVTDYQLIQWHHRQNNEYELMRLAQDIHRRAYEKGRADGREAR